MTATFPRRLVAFLATTCLAAGLIAGPGGGSALHGFAAPATPPPPPSFVPTPIGPPPPPPGASPTPAVTITSTPAAQASATAAATAVVSQEIQFSLQAARLSKANNPGDLRGLTQVKPGSRVWLMMYFSVTSLKKKTQRITRYSIFHGKKLLYRIAFAGTVTKADIGKSLSRYTVYTIPKTLPFGRYRYRAVLQIGPRHQTKEWTFTIGHADRVATSVR